MVVGKVVAHLCLTLITKELKFSVEHRGGNNTKSNQTLNIIFGVVRSNCNEWALNIYKDYFY